MRPAPRPAALLALALLCWPAAAQPPAPMTLDGKLTKADALDRLRKLSYHKAHEVELKAGTLYVIDLTSRDFDTFLRLEDDKGQPLAENDDVSKDDLNSRIAFVAPQAGKYRLVVTTYEGGATGAYRLTVQPQEAPLPEEPPLLLHGQLTKADPPDRVQKQSHHKVHDVKLEQDKAYLLTLRATGFDGYLRLEDDQGKQLGRAVVVYGLDPQLPFVAPRTGTYRLVVTSVAPGQTGWYYVSVARYAGAAAGQRREAERAFQRLLIEAGKQNSPAQQGRKAELLRSALQLCRALYPAARYPEGHPLVPVTLNYLGLLLQAQGKLDEARVHYERALAIFNKALPPDHPSLATSLNNLGSVLKAQGQLDEARAHHEQALAIFKKALPPDHPALATSLDNLGAVLRAQGKLDEARVLIEQALAIFKKALPPDHPHLATSLSNLGAVLRAQGKLDEARAHLEQALAIQKKALPPDHPHLATSLSNLGSVLQAQGQLDEARAHHEQALAIQKKALPPDHPHLAQSLSNLGAVLQAQGQLDEARACHEQALAIFKKALPPDHPDLATSLSNLGAVLQEQGKLDAARAHQERALAIYKKALPPDHPHLATSLSNLGWMLAEQGKLDEARAHLEQALALRKKALPSNHPHLANSLNNLGVVLQRMKRPDEAWPLFVAAAEVSARHAALMAAGSAQTDHPHLLRKLRGYFWSLLSAAAADLPAPRRLDLLARALDSRAVSAAALLQRRAGLLAHADADGRALAEKLLTQRRRLADLLLQGPGPRKPEQYRRDCVALQKQADALELDLAQRLKPFADLTKAQRATPAEVADRLPPHTALVELLRYHPARFEATERKSPWGPPRYAALLLWSEGKGAAGVQVRLLDLGPAAPLERAVAAWRTAVQAGRVDGERAGELRRLVWEPLAKVLPKDTCGLVIALDGALALVPFEAIQLDDGKYLIERYEVQYISTGRDLMPQPLPKERSEVALVLADPDYDRAEGSPTKAAGGDEQLRSGLKFGRLPGFAKEADAVAALLKGQPGWRVAQSRRADASEERLASVKRPRLLHLVTHGFFLEDVQREPPKDLFRDLEVIGSRPRLPSFGADPRLRSGLALAGANKWQERSAKGLSDGLLTALEVENLDLWGTELVVLSACDTGRGEVQVGEGVLGLRRAFQLAGAQTVLASLWKVPDAETGQLMSDTLSRWLKGVPPHEALRAAQLEMIRRLRLSGARNGKQEGAPPLYWAGFVCHGH